MQVCMFCMYCHTYTQCTHACTLCMGAWIASGTGRGHCTREESLFLRRRLARHLQGASQAVCSADYGAAHARTQLGAATPRYNSQASSGHARRSGAPWVGEDERLVLFARSAVGQPCLHALHCIHQVLQA